jgi:large subunit ribosomal protein L30
MNETITYSQVKSYIGSSKNIRATLIGLGIKKMYKTLTRTNTPELRGMLVKVQHLVKVEE